jgi:DNA-directed RNA polymerase specialized sigma24 family protein
MHVTRGHINDCLRKHRTQTRWFESMEANGVSVEEIPDAQAERAFEAMWNGEWKAQLLSEADRRVQCSVKDKHYEIYRLHCVNGLPVREVSQRLSVLAVTVRVVSYRVARRMRQEVQLLESRQL